MSQCLNVKMGARKTAVKWCATRVCMCDTDARLIGAPSLETVSTTTTEPRNRVDAFSVLLAARNTHAASALTRIQIAFVNVCKNTAHACLS